MKEGFGNWMFSKWYYWAISILWGLWSGSEELKAHLFGRLIGIIISSFLITTLIFLGIYKIRDFIKRQVKKELNNSNLN